jgi:AcrR family transcriptional regulator
VSGSEGHTPRPRRGRPPRISQDRIVEAAVELGLDSFSMQGIADRLGVTPPALYSHVAGREEVLDLVNTALLRHMAAFSSTADDWRAWLTDFAHEVRRHLTPSASALMVDLRGPAASVRVGMGERGLQLLMDSGFTPAEAGYVVWLVFRVAITAGAEQGTGLAGYVDDTGNVLGPRASSTVPATQAVHDALVSEGPHDTLERDLQIVLDGIARRLDASRRLNRTDRQ